MKAKRDRSKPKRLKLKQALEALVDDKDALMELAHWSAGEHGEPDDELREICRNVDALLTAINSVPDRGPKGPTTEDLKILGYVREFAISNLKYSAYAATGKNFGGKFSPCVRHVAERTGIPAGAVNSRLKRIARKHKEAWEHYREPLMDGSGRPVSMKTLFAPFEAENACEPAVRLQQSKS